MDTFIVLSAIDPIPMSPNRTPSMPDVLHKSMLLIALGGAITFGSLPFGTSTTPPRSISVDSQSRRAASDAIRSLDGLPTIWTSQEVIPLRSETISVAKNILFGLPSHLALPHVSVSADGEIALSWIEADDRFEAVLTPDHHLIWASKLRGEFESGDDIEINSNSNLAQFYSSVEKFYELT